MGSVDVAEMRVDLRSDDHIFWLNNIETGRLYWHWDKSLSSLLKPAFPGHMHKVKRNLYSLVALIDPASVEAIG